MKKTLSQIPLNFGEEPATPSPPSGDANGAGSQQESPYMAAAGVGVRVKSYKNAVVPTSSGNLFQEPALPAAVVDEPASPAVMAEEATPPAETSGIARAAAIRTGQPGSSKRGRKSLKQAAAEADLIDIPADEILFGKQYYTMGEVSAMFKVNQSLLRYWETEFDILQPKKNKKGDRYFRPVDIKNLHLIYHLLRQKKYTIEGAREFLRKNKKAKEQFEVIERLQQIKGFLLEWKAQL